VKQSSVDVSIVVPAYKAEKFIADNLLQFDQAMSQTRYSYEIICVVDGYSDKTKQKALKVSRTKKNIRVVGYKTNVGKGNAVRIGMGLANGRIVGFVDAGIELSPNGISMLLEHFEWYKADIIIGSKRHPASKIEYPGFRVVMSVVYQILVRILFGLNVKDTQVGMKFFKAEILKKILPRLLVKKFAFDIEMLAVANSLGYKKIYEAPVELKMNFSGTSTIMTRKFVNVVAGMVWDTLAVFYRLRIIGYYKNDSKFSWAKFIKNLPS